MEYPDTRAALRHLIDGTTHADQTVTAYYELSIGFTDTLPAALIYVTGGTEGYFDRVDRATIEVYAPGEQALAVAESVRVAVTHRDGVEVPGVGYFDAIEPDVTPADVPYQDDRTNLARATYRVTARPL